MMGMIGIEGQRSGNGLVRRYAGRVSRVGHGILDGDGLAVARFENSCSAIFLLRHACALLQLAPNSKVSTTATA